MKLANAFSHHQYTDEDHVPPDRVEFETHRNAWRGLLALSIVALLAVIAIMVSRG